MKVNYVKFTGFPMNLSTEDTDCDVLQIGSIEELEPKIAPDSSASYLD